MGLLVVGPGPYATIQDLGRPGYREWGVPVAGAFDRGSLALANALLGNSPEAAAVEMTLVGGVYEARISLAIALAGAPMTTTIRAADGRDRRLQIPQTATLQPGDRLMLGGSPRGSRTYLAVAGGWRTPLVLGSRSSEVQLNAGEVLPAVAGWSPVRRPVQYPRVELGQEPIRIVDGPNLEKGFDGGTWDALTFRVGAKSDRMGLRLEGNGPKVAIDPDRLSTPVAPGTIQATGGGLIILGVACGTMGGYPMVGQVISADLDRLAQARPGDAIRLHRITLEDARRLDRDDRRQRAGCVLRTAVLASDRGSFGR